MRHAIKFKRKQFVLIQVLPYLWHFFSRFFFHFIFFLFLFFFFEILQSKLLTLLHGEKTRDEHRMAEQKRKRNGAKT